MPLTPLCLRPVRAAPRLWAAALIPLFLLVLLPCARAWAAERILSMESEVLVHSDASLTVTERYRVAVGGQQIKRGIFRDFPTTYTLPSGRSMRVGFEVLEVSRDGRPEPYVVQDRSNGKRVRIGSADVLLPHGEHSYTLVYRTDRQVGFFKTYDELYWNATGNGWALPIDRAVCTVSVPHGAEVQRAVAYVGAYGEKGGDSDYTVRRGSTSATFATRRALSPGEGLTVAVSWPKGYVVQPDSAAADEAAAAVTDLLANNAVFIGGFGFLLLLAYYLWAWNRVGRDPQKAPIIPRFSPPEDLSPASVRFISSMGFDNRAFTSAILNAAVRGALRIEDLGGTTFLVSTDAARDRLHPGERAVVEALFRSEGSVALKKGNHKVLIAARNALKKHLRREFTGRYFNNNAKWFVPGLAWTALIALGIGLSAPETAPALGISVWLAGWTIGCFFMLHKAWQEFQRRRGVRSVLLLVFCVPFVGGWFVGAGLYVTMVGFAAGACLAAMALLDALFLHLLKAPTVGGQRMMDAIEGFRMYLDVAEKPRLERLLPPGAELPQDPPEKTPELFERFLPYAVALDVEQSWSDHLAATLARAADERQYHPAWYAGDRFHPSRMAVFSAAVGSSLDGAIASSATAPGSRSGSGGGGFSGGGGGGGGGGGW